MKTRIVHTKVWKDAWFVQLTPNAKLLWLYLLTNEKINILGIYELSDREIVFDTSIDISMLASIKDELKPKAEFYMGWVKIANVEKYNKYLNSQLNVIACITELSYVPIEVKEKLQIPTDTSIHTPINKESEISNKKTKEEIQKQYEEKKLELFSNMGWGNVKK